jgi:hypothetical protein
MSYMHVTVSSIIYDLQETGALVLDEKHLGFGAWPGFLKALGNLNADIGLDCEFFIRCRASGDHRLVVKGNDTKKPLTLTLARRVIRHLHNFCNHTCFQALLHMWETDKRLFMPDVQFTKVK